METILYKLSNYQFKIEGKSFVSYFDIRRPESADALLYFMNHCDSIQLPLDLDYTNIDVDTKQEI